VLSNYRYSIELYLKATLELEHKHNVPMAKYQERIKQWRAQVLAVELAGAREHALGQLAKKMGHKVRWAPDADAGEKFEVSG
jgi:hypothetical protein